MYTNLENTQIKEVLLNDIDQLINAKKTEIKYIKEQQLKSILESVLRVTNVDVTERSNRTEVADAVKSFFFIAREHTKQ